MSYFSPNGEVDLSPTVCTLHLPASLPDSYKKENTGHITDGNEM